MDFWFTFIGLGLVLVSENENQRTIGAILAGAGASESLRKFTQREQ